MTITVLPAYQGREHLLPLVATSALGPTFHQMVHWLRDEALNDHEKKPADAKRLRQQIKNGEYRDALRTRYKLVPNDTQFDQLLGRLVAAERKKKL